MDIWRVEEEDRAGQDKCEGTGVNSAVELESVLLECRSGKVNT